MGDSLGQFGDPRRERAGSFFLARLIEVGQSGVRVRPLGGDRAGEVRLGRFLRNRHVTPAEMVTTASARTATLVEGRHILAIQSLPPDLIRGTPPACATMEINAVCSCIR
jgi:hypothetical protein